jgi:hypothetical protein
MVGACFKSTFLGPNSVWQQGRTNQGHEARNVLVRMVVTDGFRPSMVTIELLPVDPQ